MKIRLISEIDLGDTMEWYHIERFDERENTWVRLMTFRHNQKDCADEFYDNYIKNPGLTSYIVLRNDTI